MLPVAVVGALVSLVTPLSPRPVVVVVLLALAAAASWGHDRRLAWCWGFLLPIDVLQDVPAGILDVARYGGVVWLCLRFAPTLSTERRGYVIRLAGLAAAVAVIRGLGSTARVDRFGMLVAAVMFVGALVAPFVAYRVRAHRAILAGFVAGTALTAIVSIMQALELPTLREGNQEGSRFPGLASTTMLTTWHLALALVTACYFVRRDQPRAYRLVALGFLPLGSIALVVNGAQGGLLGLAAAAFFAGIWAGRRPAGRAAVRTAAPYVAGATAVLAILVVGLVLSDVRTPTLDGLRGEGGYRNELARWEVDKQGLEVIADHPLVGVGRTNFEDRYDLAPHFLPLEAGVTSGVIGLLVGGYLLLYLLSLVLRGPGSDAPSAWLGLALAGAMWSNTLIETGGPFTGLPRFALLLIAVIAARGEPWPSTDDEHEPAAYDEVSPRRSELAGRLSVLRPRRAVG